MAAPLTDMKKKFKRRPVARCMALSKGMCRCISEGPRKWEGGWLCPVHFRQAKLGRLQWAVRPDEPPA